MGWARRQERQFLVRSVNTSPIRHSGHVLWGATDGLFPGSLFVLLISLYIVMQDNLYITISFFRGWLVTFAATGIGLVFGVLYVWSVLKGGIPASWGWSNADKALPYSVMAITFSLVMVPAGELQDRYGPRLGIMLGGLLAGSGCILAGLLGSSLVGYVVGLGMVTGCGVGLGYAALTPAAIKWFAPERTGLVAGLVVAGSGLAPVLLAPLAAWFLQLFASVDVSGNEVPGVSGAMIAFGLLIWLVVALLVGLIKNPPPGFIPLRQGGGRAAGELDVDFSWQQMLLTGHFSLLFFMYFSGAAAGLVFISVAADFGSRALGSWAFLAVVVLALGNSSGRVLAGYVSDRLGRELTLGGQFLLQTLVVAGLGLVAGAAGTQVVLLLLLLFLLGANYGSNLALFPAICRQYYGMRSFGLNYGCLFLAFGVAGVTMPLLNGFILDATGSQRLTYWLVGGLLLASAGCAALLRFLGKPQLQRREIP